MTNSESKFYNTSLKMNEAMMILLQEKNLPEISVAELCEKAGVNRTTFYSHYKNTYDLFKEIIDRKTIKLYSLYGFTNFDINNTENLNKEDVYFITPKFILPFLHYTKDNLDFFNIYWKNFAYLKTDKIVDKYKEILFYPIFKAFGITDKKIMNYNIAFYIAGMISIVGEWVRTGCKDDPSEVCEIILEIFKIKKHI